MVDEVKKVHREHPEADPWRQGGVCHSGSRNCGMQLLTDSVIQTDAFTISRSEGTRHESPKVWEEKTDVSQIEV